MCWLEENVSMCNSRHTLWMSRYFINFSWYTYQCFDYALHTLLTYIQRQKILRDLTTNITNIYFFFVLIQKRSKCFIVVFMKVLNIFLQLQICFRCGSFDAPLSHTYIFFPFNSIMTLVFRGQLVKWKILQAK